MINLFCLRHEKKSQVCFDKIKIADQLLCVIEFLSKISKIIDKLALRIERIRNNNNNNNKNNNACAYKNKHTRQLYERANHASNYVFD